MSFLVRVRARDADPARRAGDLVDHGVGEAARRPLRWGSGISVAAVSVVLAAQLVAPVVWQRWPWLPFAIGLLAGLPHGALDHLVPWWTGATARSARRTAVVLLGYVALAGATFLAARAWPVPALVVLLAGSLVHFGTGETEVARLRGGRPPARFAWVGPGATVIALPFVVWPADVRPVLDVLAPGAAAVLLSPAVLHSAAVLAGAAIVVTLASDAARGRWPVVAETVLLVALFVLVPPLPAFGVWFGAWHGLRHLLRLVAVDPANAADLAAGRLARPVGRIAAHAALPTLAVVAVLVVLVAVPGLFPPVAVGLTSAALALVLALTVPHMVVVRVLDRRQHSGPGRPA